MADIMRYVAFFKCGQTFVPPSIPYTNILPSRFLLFFWRFPRDLGYFIVGLGGAKVEELLGGPVGDIGLGSQSGMSDRP